MLSLLSAVGRLIIRAAVVLVLLALLLGRYAPTGRDARSDEARHEANPRYRPIRSYYFSDRPHVPRILDAETGVVAPCSLPDAERLDFLGCSPWRDGAGQHHVRGALDERQRRSPRDPSGADRNGSAHPPRRRGPGAFPGG